MESPEQQESYHPNHKPHIAPIRTFNSDMAEAVREKGGSIVRVAIAEEERHRIEHEEASIGSKKNMAFVAGGIIVLIAAVGFFVWSYTQHKQASTPPLVQTTQPSSLISADTSAPISISGMQIPDMVTAIQTAVNDPAMQSGTIKNIVLAEGANGAETRLSAAQFLMLLGAHTSTSFAQALLPDMMLGAYRYDTGTLFLVVHGTAHDFLQAGMLAWEPYLFNDLTPLFAVDTSTFTKAQLQSVPFKDTIIANHDARAAFDASGKPLLFYSFLDTNTIIITTDPKTLTEAVRRFH